MVSMLNCLKVCWQHVAAHLFLTFYQWRNLMVQKKKFILSILFCITLISLSLPLQVKVSKASSSISFIFLSKYKATADIGDEFYLTAVTSNGKAATWKSSDSKIASVNTYGKIIAKKAGIVLITANIKNAKASCQITVNKTEVILNTNTAMIERGETCKLSATTSNKSNVTWKSSKKSIATVNDYGTVIGIKPGQTMITAKADGTTSSCVITVKSPTVKLDKTTLQLYRGQSYQLSAKVSSNVNPIWKTNKKSVAIVNANGSVTAVKNGVATITATVDGISKTCEVIVLKPEIVLSSTELYLKPGETATITATISSNNPPSWSSSNTKVASVNSSGIITALKKGTAYIYASEDGTKVRCKITVTE